MELPQLFGSDYVLPAIIAVVLLLAILGLLMLRRKQKAGPAAPKGRGRGAAAPLPDPGAAPGAWPGAPGAGPGAQLSRAELKTAKADAKAQAKAAKAAAKAAKKAGMDVTQSTDFFGDAAAGEAADFFAAAPPPPPSFAAAPTWTAGEAAPPEPAAGDAAQAPPTAPDAPPLVQPAGPKYTPGVRQGTSFAGDPLQAVLNSILMGWGDLSTEDTNRLEVFKPERVLAAISAIELPKDLKSSEYARTRLNQLKRYSAYLGQSEQPAPPKPIADDFAAIGITPQAASQIQSGFGAGGGPAAPMMAAGAAIAGAAEKTEGPPAAESTPVEPEPAPQRSRPSWYGPVDDLGTPEIEIVPPEEIEAPLINLFAEPPALAEPPLFAEPQALAEPPLFGELPTLAEPPIETEAVDFSWDTALPSAAAAAFEEAVSLEMPSEVVGFEVPMEIEELMAAEEAVDVAGTVDVAGAVDVAGTVDKPPAQAPTSTEDAIAIAAAAFWATPEADAMERTAEERSTPAFEEPLPFGQPPVVREPPMFDEPPVVHEPMEFTETPAPTEPSSVGGPALSTAGGWISTADELLALPADEQARMLGHLEPPELSKVFKAARDSNFKKAVIDTLERTGSTASLDVIRECLDDPDPLIQLYALDAADRLLGSGV